MMQVVPMTLEEKVKMYEKLSKKELIAMLLENQRLVELLIPQPQPFYPVTPQWPVTVQPPQVVPESPWYTTCGDSRTVSN